MLLAALLAMGSAHAAGFEVETLGERTPAFGAGLVVGDPTGVSLGWRPDRWKAVEVGLGYDVLDGDLKGTADYLQSLAVIDPNTTFRVPLYVGAGLGIGRDMGAPDQTRVPVATDTREPAESRMNLAARVPLGASLLFDEMPVEVFAHAIPSIRVLPDRKLDIDGALGVRYYW